MVDVTAHHAVSASLAGFVRHGGLEVAHVAHCALDLQLEIARQAPVGQPKPRPQAIEPAVDLQAEFVGCISKIGQPLGALDDAIEKVPVRHPQAPPIGRDMDALLRHVHPAKVVRDIAPCELVMVAGNEDDAHTFSRLAQDLLHHIVVQLRPVPGAPQLPAVDDVAHQVQRVALDVAQEVEQRLRLTPRGAEMQIGDPDGADINLHCRVIIHRTLLKVSPAA
jgi:hypothetical protein